MVSLCIKQKKGKRMVGMATTQSLNRSMGISWRNRIGFWMQRDRPDDVSREQTTTSQSRRLVKAQERNEKKKKMKWNENEKWQWSRKSERIVAALECNRKITGRLKSLRNREWKKEKKKKKEKRRKSSSDRRSQGIPREFEGLCLIVLRYADSSEWSCLVLNP